MDTKTKFYRLWAAIGLLLCLNIATIGWVAYRVDFTPKNQQRQDQFIVRWLSLTPNQIGQYRQSRNQMKRQMKPHEDSLRLLRSELFSRVKQPAISDAGMNQLLNQIAVQNGEITRLRFRHWHGVRGFCTPGQQIRFDRLVARLEREVNNTAKDGSREQVRHRF